MESLEIILSASGKSFTRIEKEIMSEEKNELYRSLLNRLRPSYAAEETRVVLDALQKKGYKLAIGSSSKNTPLILARTDLEKYFHAVSDGNNITRSKPDPEVFLKAAEYLAAEPGDCLVVEDAEAGIDAGVSGGFHTAGIGPAEKYGKTEFPIRDLSDLLPVLGGAAGQEFIR